MITIKQSGDFLKTERFLKKSLGTNYMQILHKYGKLGVQQLAAATPVDTGLTAASWGYEIDKNEDGYSIVWYNTNVVDGWANVALLLQYGHGTGGGGYVEGIDYINPALSK